MLRPTLLRLAPRTRFKYRNSSNVQKKVPLQPYNRAHMAFRFFLDASTVALIILGGVALVKTGPFWNSSAVPFRERMGMDEGGAKKGKERNPGKVRFEAESKR